jgi:hypothetical protein
VTQVTLTGSRIGTKPQFSASIQVTQRINGADSI